MEKQIESQNRAIRRHLESGKRITALDALYQFGCFRLSARIFDLRRMGLDIKVQTISVQNPKAYHGTKHLTCYFL